MQNHGGLGCQQLPSAKCQQRVACAQGRSTAAATSTSSAAREQIQIPFRLVALGKSWTSALSGKQGYDYVCDTTEPTLHWSKAREAGVGDASQLSPALKDCGVMYYLSPAAGTGWHTYKCPRVAVIRSFYWKAPRSCMRYLLGQPPVDCRSVKRSLLRRFSLLLCMQAGRGSTATLAPIPMARSDSQGMEMTE